MNIKAKAVSWFCGYRSLAKDFEYSALFEEMIINNIFLILSLNITHLKTPCKPLTFRPISGIITKKTVAKGYDFYEH